MREGRRGAFERLAAHAPAVADHRQELPAGRRVVAKRAQHAAGHHRDARLVHAAGGHAFVGASITTATPRGWSTSWMALAICAVSFSWICSRRA